MQQTWRAQSRNARSTGPVRSWRRTSSLNTCWLKSLGSIANEPYRSMLCHKKVAKWWTESSWIYCTIYRNIRLRQTAESGGEDLPVAERDFFAKITSPIDLTKFKIQNITTQQPRTGHDHPSKAAILRREHLHSVPDIQLEWTSPKGLDTALRWNHFLLHDSSWSASLAIASWCSVFLVQDSVHHYHFQLRLFFLSMIPPL